MTLNIFFLTITIQPRKLTKDELEHARRVKKIEEQMKDRKYEFHRFF
ncbi:YrzI family small protein [Metabacillus iocasae]|uniref:Uncharacterized protein (TIGR02413 family) n=1 Tax=Priestia iocasae TaxID=2291674 RepID=A0ABS2QPR0_9BACI|nr:YrzI family small protein [Metabacillus iocasae]MBM7701440.1 uncharacterized protein (TIGR02413 family) [Metabacillus iocasae]